MGDRGRESAEDLTTVAAIPKHLEPPPELTELQKDVWSQAVRSMEVGFFKVEHRPSLEAYARHTIRERELSKRLTELDIQEDLAEYKVVRDMVDKESSKILAHMRSLRLTPQSQYDEKKASRKSQPSQNAPWQKSS